MKLEEHNLFLELKIALKIFVLFSLFSILAYGITRDLIHSIDFGLFFAIPILIVSLLGGDKI